MHSLESQLLFAWPAERWRDVGLVVAVSGGADSVALLHALNAVRGRQEKSAGARGELAVAHLNHRLRGAESEADETFVKTLADQLRLRCLTDQADVAALAAQDGDGLEAAARSARYAFLQKVAEQAGARYVATAHTADDQAETVLHNLLRGTGLAGLAGMPQARPLGDAVSLVRPLLGVRRAEVLDYLQNQRHDWREDASNAGRDFLRNRIRLDLLPSLERDYAAGVRESLCRLAQQAADAHAALQPEVERLLAVAVVRQESASNESSGIRGSGFTVAREPLAEVPRHLIRELFNATWRAEQWPLKSMGFTEWEQLAEMLLQPESCVRIFPGKVRAEVLPGRLWLSREV